MQTSSEKRASIKMQAKGSLIEEYVLTLRTDYRCTADWKTIKKELTDLQTWLKSVEVFIRQKDASYKMRWSNISSEMMYHYYLHLLNKANRHQNRIVRIHKTIETCINYWEWMKREYGNGQLKNAAQEGRFYYLANTEKKIIA